MKSLWIKNAKNAFLDCALHLYVKWDNLPCTVNVELKSIIPSNDYFQATHITRVPCEKDKVEDKITLSLAKVIHFSWSWWTLQYPHLKTPF